MPELPDVTVYVERLDAFVRGRELQGIEVLGANLLRTVEPAPGSLVGTTCTEVFRIGKRIVLSFGGEGPDEPLAVIHPMIAGRLRWRTPGRKPPAGPKALLARLEWGTGTLWLTEAATKKRSSLHLVRGRDALAAFDRGGLDPLSTDLQTFTAALTRENRTLKRALTDPRILDGIGNAYSDEILFAARLSPVRLTSRLDATECERLFDATRNVLRIWTERLRAQVGDGFPEKVTAFRDGMAVHGRYRAPCPICGHPVQRIRYASNECNYCAECQNAGRLLADRGLSQLLRQDWPRTLEELEELRGGA